jgi:succinate-semialdehyde dehydrogenase/glutarate-semialdehyde dehydrogenase
MATIRIVNPATGELEGEVPNHTVAQCLAAAQKANEAFISWRTTLPRQRAEILRRAFEIMIAEQEQLATLIVRENGVCG